MKMANVHTALTTDQPVDLTAESTNAHKAHFAA